MAPLRKMVIKWKSASTSSMARQKWRGRLWASGTVLPAWKQWLSGLDPQHHFCCHSTNDWKNRKTSRNTTVETSLVCNKWVISCINENKCIFKNVYGFLHLKCQHLGLRQKNQKVKVSLSKTSSRSARDTWDPIPENNRKFYNKRGSRYLPMYTMCKV